MYPEVQPLGISLSEIKTYVHMKICMQIFIAISFVIVKNLKQPKLYSVGKWVNKPISISTQLNATQQ